MLVQGACAHVRAANTQLIDKVQPASPGGAVRDYVDREERRNKKHENSLPLVVGPTAHNCRVQRRYAQRRYNSSETTPDEPGVLRSDGKFR